MTRELKVKGNALGVFFAVVYVLCVAWDAIFPAWAMRSVWAGLFPGWSGSGPETSSSGWQRRMCGAGLAC